MKLIIKTTALIAALAISSSAIAGSMEEDIHGVCMKDGENTAAECSCAVDLVKTGLSADDYVLLHALATTEEGSEERQSKLVALAATPEKMQGVIEKFQPIATEMKSKCNVDVNNGEEG